MAAEPGGGRGRSTAAPVRVDTVLATNGVIRALERYQMMFSSARKF